MCGTRIRTPSACVSYAPTGYHAARSRAAYSCMSLAVRLERRQFQLGHRRASIPSAEKGLAPEAAFLLLPRGSWSIEDDWHVAGQAGTGSKTISVATPTFVPGHRRLLVSAASAGASPGTALNRHSLYRVPMLWRCRSACCRRCWARRLAPSSSSSNCAARA